nr:unnamed protein product [Spirometra erinaceieuropaei]
MGSGDASIKAPELVSLLQGEGFTVNVVATKAAHHFFDKKDIIVPMYEDEDEFNCWSSRGDDVLHIKLKNWADVFLIAPMSANTLAKISNGLADNLLTYMWKQEENRAFCAGYEYRYVE